MLWQSKIVLIEKYGICWITEVRFDDSYYKLMGLLYFLLLTIQKMAIRKK